MDRNSEQRDADNLAFQSIMLVAAARIYDVLLVIASNVDPVNTSRLIDFHAEGRTHMPPPTIRTDNDE